MKLCGMRWCLCTDTLSVGSSMCPVKDHRNKPCEKIFDKTPTNDKQCLQCVRCRDRNSNVKRNQDKKEKDFLETYTEEEKMMWKVAIGSDEEPVMPELRLKEGAKPTHFSSEMAPHKWVDAHKMLMQWEKEAGRMFPKSHKSMDVFWHRTTVVFNRTFDPRPRKYTKEVIQPHLVAVRLMRTLSLLIKNEPLRFANVEKPTLEEWITIMKENKEPLFQSVVVQFCVPLYKGQGRLPPSYEVGY